MWLKKHEEIIKYIPEDGKDHDVQIINNEIYVDGELKNPYIIYIYSFRHGFSRVRGFNKALTNKEVGELYRHQGGEKNDL